MTTIIRYPSPLSAPISKAVRAGGFIFLSGQTPKNKDLTAFRGDIQAQTRNVLEAVKASLVELGSDMDRVVRCTVWLSDIRFMAPFNDVYLSYFQNALPVRSAVEARLSQGVDVEVEVTALAG